MSKSSHANNPLKRGILGNYERKLDGVVFQKNGRIRIGNIANKKRKKKKDEIN